jgi:hypothetical protein
MAYISHFFDNIGVLIDKVPAEVLEQISAEVDITQNDWSSAKEANATLAGAIEKEYFIDKKLPMFEDYISWLIYRFDSHYNYTPTLNSRPTGNQVDFSWYIEKLWVNFQKKHEYNPVHNHRGEMSFVIWLKIPYTLEQEQSLNLEKNDYPKTVGCFQFLYTNSLGQIVPYTIPSGKELEGHICIFPSKMMHCVYPFYTSDDYRITISGNVSRLYQND